MPGLDLPAAWLGTTLEIISRHAPQAEVWAFGSRVTGGNHDGSDLDLVLRNPADLRVPQPALGRLIQAFIDSELPVLVELHDWARLPAAFQREIERAYVALPENVRAM